MLLFTAPTTADYTCTLTATKGTEKDPATDVTITALARVNNISTTWLEVSTANDTGAGWWQDPPCDKDGDTAPTPAEGPSACRYLAGAANVQHIHVFSDDGSPAQMWTAPPNAAFLDASASLMLTSCKYNTSSCPADQSQSFWSYVFDGDNGGTVNTHLELNQLYPNGETCVSAMTPEERSFVGNDAHHNMHYYSLSNVPVYPCGGSRRFNMQIAIDYVAGVPLKLDGPMFTHGFVIDSASGTALPVPNLSGLAESAAITSITNAGYNLSTVSYSLNSTPRGTVIFQYPPAGIIEYPGSGVELTVSTGGGIVPNLLGDSQASATTAITALGLFQRWAFLTPAPTPERYSHKARRRGLCWPLDPLSGSSSIVARIRIAASSSNSSTRLT